MLQVCPDILIAARQNGLAAEAAHERLVRQMPAQPSIIGQRLTAAVRRLRRSVSQLGRTSQPVALRTDSDLISA